MIVHKFCTFSLRLREYLNWQKDMLNVSCLQRVSPNFCKKYSHFPFSYKISRNIPLNQSKCNVLILRKICNKRKSFLYVNKNFKSRGLWYCFTQNKTCKIIIIQRYSRLSWDCLTLQWSFLKSYKNDRRGYIRSIISMILIFYILYL